MKWTNWIQNSVEVLLTSADIHASLQAISNSHIAAWDICFVDALHLRFFIPSRSLSALLALAQKRGDQLQILHRTGILQTLGKLKKRPILLLGFLIMFILSAWLPTRVLFVRVDGNVRIPSKHIVSQAELCGIRFGASRRAVRSEAVKNALLSQLPQLQWAGVNTYGCTAVISVRERSEQIQPVPDCSFSSIVATQDAYIRQMTVVSGNPLCKVGQAVKKGQVLVSAYTDCGLCVRLTDAKAEIYGDTQRQLSVICPTDYENRTQISSRSKKYSLIIGKKRINFYKGSGISGISCAKIYEEKYLTLPGGFVLPVGIITEEWIDYEMSPEAIVPAESVIIAFSRQLLLERMQAGQILDDSHNFFYETNFCRLDSSFGCYEMIGITRPEEGITDNE